MNWLLFVICAAPIIFALFCVVENIIGNKRNRNGKCFRCGCQLGSDAVAKKVSLSRSGVPTEIWYCLRCASQRALYYKLLAVLILSIVALVYYSVRNQP